MKWRNTRLEENLQRNSQDIIRTRIDDRDDIRRSIEELDRVIDEFDGDRIPNTSKSRKKDRYVDNPINLNIENFIDPVQQSLDILDTVLAQFEDESESNTKEIYLSEEPNQIPNHTLNGSNQKEQSQSNDDDEEDDDDDDDEEEYMPKSSDSADENLASPQSQQFRKVFPPPVPKRSPTTCLSCSSSPFDCPSPEIETTDILNRKPDFAINENSANCSKNPRKVSKDKKLCRNRGRLSSKPVLKGSRPLIKSNDAASNSQDDLSDNEDEVFQNLLDNTENNCLDEIERNSSASKVQTVNNNNNLKVDKNVMNTFINEKFSLAKHLLRTGQLIGLEDKPPSFKAPPPSQSPLTKKSATTKTELKRPTLIHDSNSNDNKNKSEFLQLETNSCHVTSVKITQPSVQNSNISVITIQPKTPPPPPPPPPPPLAPPVTTENCGPNINAMESSPSATNVKERKMTTTDKDSIIMKAIEKSEQKMTEKKEQNITLRNEQKGGSLKMDKFASNNANFKAGINADKKEQSNNEQKASSNSESKSVNSSDFRPSLSTFTQRQQHSATSSKSSSLEDMVSSNSSRYQTEALSTQSKSGTLPLELKKQPGLATGAVFFNIYQCSSDGEKEKLSKEKLNDVETMLFEEKKSGWKHKKSKKKKTKEEPIETTVETTKVSAEQSALLAELTGKIQTKKTAMPNGSSSDESEDGHISNDQAAATQELATTAKDEKEKKPWKGLFKKNK